MSIFSLISDDDIKKLDIEQIKKIIAPRMKGLTIHTPIIPQGSFFYRARKLNDLFHKNKKISLSELSYPSANIASIGRANRENSPLFYCSLSKEPVFYELQNLKAGDEIIISFWQLNKRMIVNNIGYTEATFNQLGTRRICPKWSSDSYGTKFSVESIDQAALAAVKLAAGKNADLLNALSSAFMSDIDKNHEYRYKLTIAIAESHFGDIHNSSEKINGILYPSVRTWAEGDNLAIKPEFVDKNLIFKKAMHVRIESKETEKFSITLLDQGSLDNYGNLRWVGGLPTITCNPSDRFLFTATAGVDSNGDYFRSPDGTPCHWRGVNEATKEIVTFE